MRRRAPPPTLRVLAIYIYALAQTLPLEDATLDVKITSQLQIVILILILCCCFLTACSHHRHGQDKTVLSCFVRVGGVNRIGDKTTQFCLVSTQFPICNCSVSIY